MITINTFEDHELAIALAGELMDTVPDEPNHPLNPLMRLLADAIETYEQKLYGPVTTTPSEMLAFLMDQHGLKQSDLAAELGGQGIVSALLNGKRELNKRQIEALSQRFGVSPAVFFNQG